MENLREQAESQLQRREVTHGRVTNRQRYLDAIVRRLEREQARLPAVATGQAQDAIYRRNDEERQSLPEAAGGDGRTTGAAWLAIMRKQLGRPRNPQAGERG